MTESLLDEDFLSDLEKTPRHDVTVVKEVAATCPECGASFTGKTRNAQLGTHRFAKHKVKGTSPTAKDNRSKSKTAAKKKAPQPLTAKVKQALTTPEAGRRKPASDIIRRIFVQGAKVAMQVDPPVGASLLFVSAAAGEALDKAAAGTFVDKLVLQKLAGASEKWESLSSVVGLPIMVGLVSRYPQLFSALEDDMREAIEDVMVLSIPALEKKAARQKRAADAWQRYAALDPEVAGAADPVGELLRGMLPAYVFAPPEPAESVAGPL